MILANIRLFALLGTMRARNTRFEGEFKEFLHQQGILQLEFKFCFGARTSAQLKEFIIEEQAHSTNISLLDVEYYQAMVRFFFFILLP